MWRALAAPAKLLAAEWLERARLALLARERRHGSQVWERLEELLGQMGERDDWF